MKIPKPIKESHTNTYDCPYCKGNGYIPTRKTKEGYPIQHIKCITCKDTGKVIKKE